MKQLRLPLLILLLMMTVLPAASPAFAESIGGKDIFYTKPVKSVLFSHKVHVDEKGLDCEMCHMKLFDLRALAAQERPDFTMKSLNAGKYCGACHDGKMAFASDTQCARCHDGVKGYEAALARGTLEPSAKPSQGPKPFVYKPKDIGSVTFSHEFHANAYSCKDCHTTIFRIKKGGSKMNMNAMYSGGFCGKCHDGKTAAAVTECAKCHAPQ